MSDLPTISDALKNEPESLRQKILTGVAKIEGLADFVGINAMQRGSSRLDAKARAVYRKQGLEVPEDENITNILGDVTMSKDESERSRGVPGWLAATIALGSAGLGIAAAGLIPDSTPEPPPAAVQPIHGYRLEIE